MRAGLLMLQLLLDSRILSCAVSTADAGATGPALAACWAVIGSDGCLGCSAEELEADMLPEPAAEAAAMDAAGSTSQQGAAAGGKRHGWGKKGRLLASNCSVAEHPALAWC